MQGQQEGRCSQGICWQATPGAVGNRGANELAKRLLWKQPLLFPPTATMLCTST